MAPPYPQHCYQHQYYFLNLCLLPYKVANTDDYIHNGKKYNLIDYAKSTIEDLPNDFLYANLLNYYSNNGLYASTVKYDKDSANTMRMSASGDDPIVQIIPKEFFTSTNPQHCYQHQYYFLNLCLLPYKVCRNCNSLLVYSLYPLKSRIFHKYKYR